MSAVVYAEDAAWRNMKKFLFALLHSTRVIRVISWVNRKHVPILCYHSVIDSEHHINSDPHKQHIPLPLFLQHLDYLQKYHHVLTLNEFQRARRENRALPNHAVVLTFDDGFQDFATVVAPHLMRRNLPATVFVITGRAYGSLPPNGESFLTWEEIRELAKSGLDIGSHTCAHPHLPDLSLPDVMRELSESQAAVRNHTQQAEVALSYPFGQTTEQISRIAGSAGYSCAIAADCGPNPQNVNLHALSRTIIASDDDVPSFAARVSGLTRWITRIRRVFRADRKESRDPSFSARYRSTTVESYD
ncbi:MAG TPA: polysaccharide deacetylase family protein [Pyrinomonadaceae bacterium]|nr:polysaccharide deacetylase family protein [Pyrinomonadaceae bacterium]